MPAFPVRTGLLASGLAMLLCSSACGRRPATKALGGDDGRIVAGSPSPRAHAGSPFTPTRAKNRRTPRWSGRYFYEFDAGRTAGGSAETVTYVLTLDASGCRFEAEGFQTDETIVCSSRLSAGDLDVLFRSYEGGATEDRYGNAVYGVGDPLFALSADGAGIVTHWKGYPLPDDRPHAPGRYFYRRGSS